MLSKKQNIENTFNKDSKRLLNYIRRFIPYYEAEDVLQDVFTQLFVGYDQIRALENLSSWLFKTAMNRIIDLKRKKKPDLLADKNPAWKKNHSSENLSLEDILPALTDDPEDELFRKAIWNEINDALDEMPEEQSEVFILHEFEGRSFKDIAIITGENTNTLISRKRYAVLALREKLNELYNLLN